MTTKKYQLVFWSWLNWTSFRAASKTRGWILNRFALWERTAMNSIMRQSVADWHYMLLCDPACAKITEPLKERITDPRISIVHGDEEEREWRRNLPLAEKYVVARLDSDDRYHPQAGRGFLRNAMRATPQRPYLQYNVGFAHDHVRNQLFDWTQRSSPFVAMVLGAQYRQRSRIRFLPHHKIAEVATALGGGYFMVTIHGNNTSTRSTCGCIKDPLSSARALSVAKQFGISKIAVIKEAKKREKKPWHGLTQNDLPREVRAREPFAASGNWVRRR